MRTAVLLLALAAAAAPGCAREAPGRREQALAERDRLPAALRARVDRSSVPVLLPAALQLDRASLVVEPMFTALSVPGPGITVSLHSVRIAHDHPGVIAGGAPRVLRGVKGFVTVDEGIRTASWIEGGVTHALDVECAAPDDARCADDGYLLSLVEGLVVAGGEGSAP